MLKKMSCCLFFRWDPSARLTPEEALQHEWIKEGLVHRRKDQSKHTASKQTTSAHSDHSTDPYKTPAQPPVKGNNRPISSVGRA